jgi:hypothetical protein
LPYIPTKHKEVFIPFLSMSDEELTIKRLKASVRHSPSEGARVIRAASKTKTTPIYRAGWARGNATVLPVAPRMQRSTVMIRYSENKVVGSWKAHGSYLAREHAQEEGKRGLGFNESSDAIDIGQLLDEWQKSGDALLWKIIVSPEFGDRLDLREHAKLLVLEMEKHLQTRLEWVAIDHYNTDNPHLHLLISGRNAEGGMLMLDKGYISEGIRLQSGAVATQQIGCRTSDDAARARDRQVESSRFTEKDREIIRKSVQTPDGMMFRMEKLAKYSASAKIARLQTIERMNRLVALGLATYTDHLSWKITPGIEKELRSLGIISTHMKILDRHRHLLTDKDQKLVRSELKEEGQRLTGIILGSGIDPETDKPYLLIEGIDGNAHFLLQSRKLEEMRLHETIKDGAVISVEVKSFEAKEGEAVKTIRYHHIESFGTKTQALQDSALLDKELLAGITQQRSLSNNGFASLFHQALEARAEKLQAAMSINVLDKILATFKGQLPEHTQLPTMRLALQERTQFWKVRNIDVRDTSFLKKATQLVKSHSLSPER